MFENLIPLKPVLGLHLSFLSVNSLNQTHTAVFTLLVHSWLPRDHITRLICFKLVLSGGTQEIQKKLIYRDALAIMVIYMYIRFYMRIREQPVLFCRRAWLFYVYIICMYVQTCINTKKHILNNNNNSSIYRH